MDTKGLRHFEIKAGGKGEITAVFATFNAVDADGDVTLEGAFDDGAQTVISQYAHTSWTPPLGKGLLPAGTGRIHTTSEEAILEGRFFMDTDHGRNTFRTVKALHEEGQGDWSYGYDAVGAYYGDFQGRKVRFLPKQIVHEVSPCLVGSGVNTRTLSAKSATPGQSPGRQPVNFKTAIRAHETDVVNRPWDVGSVLSAVPDTVSVSDLRSMAAWFDPTKDPETKSAYGFWHHHGPGGPANVRACVAGIAVLNGARSAGGQWSDAKQGIWEHLAGHLRDADREPPPLKSGNGSVESSLLVDEIAAALAGVGAALDSASRVVALRAAKGKSLSKVNAEYLDWLDEDLMAMHRRLRSFIDSPDDDAAREYLRYVALQRGEAS